MGCATAAERPTRESLAAGCHPSALALARSASSELVELGDTESISAIARLTPDLEHGSVAQTEEA
jgi:hypothetical protein